MISCVMGTRAQKATQPREHRAYKIDRKAYNQPMKNTVLVSACEPMALPNSEGKFRLQLSRGHWRNALKWFEVRPNESTAVQWGIVSLYSYE